MSCCAPAGIRKCVWFTSRPCAAATHGNPTNRCAPVVAACQPTRAARFVEAHEPLYAGRNRSISRRRRPRLCLEVRRNAASRRSQAGIRESGKSARRWCRINIGRTYKSPGIMINLSFGGPPQPVGTERSTCGERTRRHLRRRRRPRQSVCNAWNTKLRELRPQVSTRRWLARSATAFGLSRPAQHR